MYELEKDLRAFLEFNRIYYKPDAKKPHHYFVDGPFRLLFRFDGPMGEQGEYVSFCKISFRNINTFSKCIAGGHTYSVFGCHIAQIMDKLVKMNICTRASISSYRYPEKSLYHAILKPKRFVPYFLDGDPKRDSFLKTDTLKSTKKKFMKWATLEPEKELEISMP